MEIQPDIQTPADEKVRAKTSLRMSYEAQAQVIIRRLGGLETIRIRLNLSQRKMCQLLLVDPSSWTRWISDPEKTPPHILRALEWLLLVEDKYPGFDHSYWLHSRAEKHHELLESRNTQVELLDKISQLQQQVYHLENEIGLMRQENSKSKTKALQKSEKKNQNRKEKKIKNVLRGIGKKIGWFK